MSDHEDQSRKQNAISNSGLQSVQMEIILNRRLSRSKNRWEDEVLNNLKLLTIRKFARGSIESESKQEGFKEGQNFG